MSLGDCEIKLRSIIEQSCFGIVLIDEQGTIIEWNCGEEQITGLKRDEVLGKPLWDVQLGLIAKIKDNPAMHEQIKAIVLNILKTGQLGPLDKFQETVIQHPDGTRRVIQAAIFPIETDKGFMASVISHDITRQKAAEEVLRESEEKYRVLFETAKDAIFLTDETGSFVDVNQAACKSLGYSKEELLTLSIREIDTEPIGYEAFRKVRDNLEEKVFFEVNQRRKDGTLLPVEINGDFFNIANKRISLAIARDITERKQAEAHIKTSLEEKEVLLREIHHRVKNNLQVVSSLLNMQARINKDKDTFDILSESKNRINAMALIHFQLYESDDLSKVDMKRFVDKLLRQLLQSYPVHDTKITWNVSVVDYPFPISIATSFGLIVNELLSNILKHAFNKRKQGIVKIVLNESEKGKINMIISDDGIGLPKRFDINTTGTFGLHLVKILVENQLEGNLEIINKQGTTFMIEFEIADSCSVI